MGKLHLDIVTPEKVIVSKDVDFVVAPGSEGEFGILEEHVSFLSSIVPGDLHFESDNRTEHFAVTYGFAEVFNNKVSVLVDAAENAAEIDVERARQALKRAEERLEEAQKTSSNIDVVRAEAALRRAMARIKVAESARI